MTLYKRKHRKERVVYNQMPCACAGVMAVKDKRGRSEGCAYKYELWERESYKRRLKSKPCSSLTQIPQALQQVTRLPKLQPTCIKVQNKVKCRQCSLSSVTAFPEHSTELKPLLQGLGCQSLSSCRSKRLTPIQVHSSSSRMRDGFPSGRTS